MGSQATSTAYTALQGRLLFELKAQTKEQEI